MLSPCEGRPSRTEHWFTCRLGLPAIRPVQLWLSMASYLIRVVLHGASPAQYHALHAGMAQAGAKRQVIGSNGVSYDLPDGEYVLWNSAAIDTVRNAVEAIARAAKAAPDPSVLVAEYTQIAWTLRPVPGQS